MLLALKHKGIAGLGKETVAASVQSILHEPERRDKGTPHDVLGHWCAKLEEQGDARMRDVVRRLRAPISWFH